MHTSTPWHVEHTDDGYIRINNDNGDLPIEDSGNGRHPINVSMDDAAFIVRCVNSHQELLAVLKSAHRALEILTDPNEDGAKCIGHINTVSCIQDDIEQAIARAEGK
jgi:hypothetical protein